MLFLLVSGVVFLVLVRVLVYWGQRNARPIEHNTVTGTGRSVGADAD